MANDPFAAVRGRPQPTQHRWFTAVVVRSDGGGVFASELDTDARHPTGPLKGATYRDASTCPDAAHSHPRVQLPVNTVVLCVSTAHGTWVAQHDAGVGA